jgi:hypothetical protein
MNRCLILAVGFGGWLMMSLSGCGPRNAEANAQRPAVIINKLKLTQDELQQEIAAAHRAPHAALSSTGEEPEWLSRLIEREILVQEAQRLGIDRDPAFMGTIERFWKEALIKLLLERKGREIAGQTRVYEPEIEAAYKQLAPQASAAPPESLPALREDLSRRILQDKEAEAMENWVAQLRQRAHVVIDQEAVDELQ